MYPLADVKRSPITSDGRLAGFIGKFAEPLGMDNRVYVGIDPGPINMGLAVVGLEGFIAWQCKLQQSPIGEIGLQMRIMDVMNQVDFLLRWSITDTELQKKLPARACIEQAAYAKLYGQPALAEVRTSAAVTLMRWGMPYIDAPTPNQVRKLVFGNPKTPAEIVWKDDLGTKMKGDSAVHYDGASALACAIYAVRKEQFNAAIPRT